jgi:hypothetical protein
MPAASGVLKRFVGKVRSMVAVRTLLFPVRKGEVWRVQIVWPNGMVRHVGQFASEKEAANWILAHPRLTVRAKETHDNATEGMQAPLVPR